ncbi:MAG TPA: class I SAM-dependent methyltransferase [Candidatus Acidoferrum sp.]|nr:class I SAM-dependent methyltransferase [Candidatus Acidoferrum sp.]
MAAPESSAERDPRTAATPAPPTEYYAHSDAWAARGILGALSARARRQMFAEFMNVFRPTPEDRVLDVGVTSDGDRRESNLFEALYPFPYRVVGVGRQDLRAVGVAFPHARLVRGDGCHLPFATGSFDIVASHATIEHVGHRSAQAAFVRELLRVGRRCFITTPNRWFPLELHTFLPLVHYLPPPLHRRVLRGLGRRFYAEESNLNLLARREFRDLFPAGTHVAIRFSSLATNLLAFVEGERGAGVSR